jgi:hypothetical protein
MKNEGKLSVGQIVEMGGFFTKRIQLGDLTHADNLERRIGYRSGVLDHGWFYLLMVGTAPTPAEFEFAGFSHFSGGRIKGHKYPPPSHGTDPRAVEEQLRAMNADIPYLRKQTAAMFVLSGHERLVKIVPAVRPGKDPNAYWNLNLAPIPQWRLTVPKTFLVQEFHAGKLAPPADS